MPSRATEYLHTRKEGIELNSSFAREQVPVGAGGAAQSEEQRRRMAEMRSYLDRQISDRAAARKEEKAKEALERSGYPLGALPLGSQIDAEEETYVKMALKHALDGQVERKKGMAVMEKAADLQQEQRALGHVAREMQGHFRIWSERKQQEEALRSTWARAGQGVDGGDVGVGLGLGLRGLRLGVICCSPSLRDERF